MPDKLLAPSLLFLLATVVAHPVVVAAETPNLNASIDPCALVAKETVEKVLGAKLTVEAEAAEGPYLGTCRYNRADGNNVAAIALIAAKDVEAYVAHVKGNGLRFSPLPALGPKASNSDAGVVLPLPDKALVALVTVIDYALEDGMLSQKANLPKQVELAGHIKR